MRVRDQAFFVRADLFCQLGGYGQISLMEDVDFIRRLGNLGRVETIDAPVTTSARRYESRGIIRTTLMNKILLVQYYLGYDPVSLHRLYYERGE